MLSGTQTWAHVGDGVWHLLWVSKRVRGDGSYTLADGFRETDTEGARRFVKKWDLDSALL